MKQSGELNRRKDITVNKDQPSAASLDTLDSLVGCFAEQCTTCLHEHCMFPNCICDMCCTKQSTPNAESQRTNDSDTGAQKGSSSSSED